MIHIIKADYQMTAPAGQFFRLHILPVQLIGNAGAHREGSVRCALVINIVSAGVPGQMPVSGPGEGFGTLYIPDVG